MARTTAEPSEAASAEQARRQREAAKEWEESKKKDRDLEPGMHVSSMLTTKDHVGKIADEPDKTPEMAALGQDQEARTGVEGVETKPRVTPGKGTTDEVVVEPPTHASEGHTTSPPSEADKVHAAAHPERTPGGAQAKAKAQAKNKGRR